MPLSGVRRYLTSDTREYLLRLHTLWILESGLVSCFPELNCEDREGQPWYCPRNSSFPNDFYCPTCTIAKSARKTSQQTMTRASRSLVYIHFDFCGPFLVPSYSSARYYITFVCSKTRSSWVRFLKDKSQGDSSYNLFPERTWNPIRLSY